MVLNQFSMKAQLKIKQWKKKKQSHSAVPSVARREVAYDDDVILLDEHDVPQSAAIRGFLSLFNKSPLLKDLRRCTRECWRPMLWKEATALQNFQFTKMFLEKTDPSAAKTASAALQGGLVALWKASSEKYKAKTEWIKTHFKRKAPGIEHIKIQQYRNINIDINFDIELNPNDIKPRLCRFH